MMNRKLVCVTFFTSALAYLCVLSLFWSKTRHFLCFSGFLRKKIKVVNSVSIDHWCKGGNGVNLSLELGGLSQFCYLLSAVLEMSSEIKQRKSRRTLDGYSHCQIPNVSKDIKVDRVGAANVHDHPESLFLTIHDKSNENTSEKMLVHLGRSKSSDADNISQCSSMYHHERGFSSQSGEEGSSGTVRKQPSYGIAMPSPLIGLPEISQQVGPLVHA
ncbi:hypothetical protein HAX54_022245 [Datura stramonium]|uniref:Uncharacterized protein n=1 Tax=Datura stramonium TaxID=4076 RepID=A0ABS8UWF1_DATST|nr:hypothetical protein [Datura stramonium]